MSGTLPREKKKIDDTQQNLGEAGAFPVGLRFVCAGWGGREKERSRFRGEMSIKQKGGGLQPSRKREPERLGGGGGGGSRKNHEKTEEKKSEESSNDQTSLTKLETT